MIGFGVMVGLVGIGSGGIGIVVMMGCWVLKWLIGCGGGLGVLGIGWNLIGFGILGIGLMKVMFSVVIVMMWMVMIRLMFV